MTEPRSTSTLFPLRPSSRSEPPLASKVRTFLYGNRDCASPATTVLAIRASWTCLDAGSEAAGNSTLNRSTP
jgi:hypothetical protein